MSETKKVPVYEERIYCNYCNYNLKVEDDGYFNYDRFNKKCYVCKKEGCESCMSWIKVDGKKYCFHENCKENLPRDVLKKHKAIVENERRKEQYHNSQYPMDHIV